MSTASKSFQLGTEDRAKLKRSAILAGSGFLLSIIPILIGLVDADTAIGGAAVAVLTFGVNFIRRWALDNTGVTPPNFP